MTGNTTYQEFWPQAGPGSGPPPHHGPMRKSSWSAKSVALTGVFLALFAAVTSFSTILVMQSRSPEQLAEYFSSITPHHQSVFSHPTYAPSVPTNTPTPQMLLGETLQQLSLANYTNTYSQFHHIAAPSFQRVNSAQKLRDIFAWMRQREVKLTTGTILRPMRVSSAIVDQKGFLNINGVIAAHPKPLNIKTAYQKSKGVWKLFGIHVALQR